MFTESAELYDAIYSFKDYAAEAAQIAVLVRAAHPGARSILDVACGTGEHARHLAASHGFEVDGLDLDAGLLRVAHEKHPSGRFFHADMSDFAIERRYDAVLCLFSSIAYLVTLERMCRALECFRRHLCEEGVLLVEPWFPPGGLENGLTRFFFERLDATRPAVLRAGYRRQSIDRAPRPVHDSATRSCGIDRQRDIHVSRRMVHLTKSPTRPSGERPSGWNVASAPSLAIAALAR
jgi:ubiquinone/menaquinone biosynthesis C-methylase UbiE